MTSKDYIALLSATPSPTGPELGRVLEAWAEWCKDFDEREANTVKSKYEL